MKFGNSRLNILLCEICKIWEEAISFKVKTKIIALAEADDADLCETSDFTCSHL